MEVTATTIALTACLTGGGRWVGVRPWLAIQWFAVMRAELGRGRYYDFRYAVLCALRTVSVDDLMIVACLPNSSDCIISNVFRNVSRLAGFDRISVCMSLS